MQSETFNNPNPATGESGTLVTTTWFQNVNDEISNVITKNGGTLDSTNHAQLYTTLSTTYAPLESPTFTGVPLCPDTNSSSNGRAIVNFESMKAYVSAGSLGYTPVHQGGGTGQGTNSIYIGYATSGGTLKCTVDATDLGSFAFQSWVSSNYLSLTGGNVTGTLTYNGTSVATTNDVNNAETDVKNWTASNYLSLSGGTISGSLTVNGTGIFSGDLHVGDNSWLYTNVIQSNSGSLILRDSTTIYGGLTTNTGCQLGGTGQQFTYNSDSSYHMSLQSDGNCVWYVGSNSFASISPSLFSYNGQTVATQPWANGQFVNAATYNSDFGSSGNIINLAYGHRINTFTTTITSGSRVNYPQAFSGNATSINLNSTVRLDLWVTDQDSAGFTVASNESTSQTIFVVAIGPK